MPQIHTYPIDGTPSAADMMIKQVAGGGPGSTLAITVRQVVETGSFVVATAGGVPRADGGNKISNDWLRTGPDNGLDADTLDGVHAADFALATHAHVLADVIDADSMASQDAGAVAITGGSIVGITDLAVADGGTGASTEAAARANLGIVIGTDVQEFSTALASIAGLVTTADEMIYTTAADTYATTALTPFARSLLAAIDADEAKVILEI